MLLDPPSNSLAEWLHSASVQILDRRVEPRDAARLLAGRPRAWDPSHQPVSVAGRVAEVGRASLPMACAMVHHVDARFLLGASVGADEEPVWALTSGEVVAEPGTPWTVTGRLVTCCPPPPRAVTLVVLSAAHGHLLTVGPGAPGVELVRAPTGWVVVLDSAPARVRRPFTADLLTHAAQLRRVMETAAWYGGMTRFADGILADHGAGVDTEAVTGHRLSEADAVLSAVWSGIRDALTVWQRGSFARSTTTHLVARARVTARMAAATMLCTFVGNEDAHGRRDPGVGDAREHLVAWLRRSDLDGDVGAITAALAGEGPSW